MNPTRRLTHNDTMELNNKNLVVGFLQAPLAEDVIQQFENAVEGGREHSGGYIIQVDRTVRSDVTISELHSICMEFFTTTDNSYYPFFFVILDGRTAVDGTVIIAHDRPAGYDRRAGDPPEELRVTPGSLPNLLACLDIQHTVISSILVNRMDEEDEESFVDDVSPEVTGLDYTRIPVSKLRSSEGSRKEFTVLRFDTVTKEAPDVSSEHSVKICWFGQLPEKLLMLPYIRE